MGWQSCSALRNNVNPSAYPLSAPATSSSAGAATGLATAKRELFATAGKRKLLLALVLAAITLFLYNPVSHFDFVNYDDIEYVTGNPRVQQGLTWPNVKWAFTTFDVSNWHPLTWLSHMADCSAFGVKPAGPHLHNVLLHTLNAILLFLVLASMTRSTGASFAVALFFAVHPLNVESVAWVAERKNLLSTTFWLLTMAGYLWYVRKPCLRRYVLVAVSLALGLMAKPMLVTMPAILLLLDYWPLDRIPFSRKIHGWWNPVTEKIPLLLICIASGVVTLRAESAATQMVTPGLFSRWFPVWNALWSYLMYIAKLFWPVKLAVFYPLQLIHVGQVALAAAALVTISAAVVHWRSRKYLLVGWLWFLGTLLPVIGLIQVGRQAMADRYAYVPAIGLMIMVTWVVRDFAVPKHKQIVSIFAVMVFSALALAARRQVLYWRNSETLFTHAIAATEHNYLAHVNLGGALERAGRSDEALEHFRAAVRDNPLYGTGRFDVAVELEKRGDYRQAIEQYEASLRFLDPNLLAPAHANLGVCYTKINDIEHAIRNFENALAVDPANFTANFGLGNISYSERQYESSIRYFGTAVRIQPTDQGLLWLGNSFRAAGQDEQAVRSYQEAIRINPDLEEARRAIAGLSRPPFQNGKRRGSVQDGKRRGSD